MRGPVVTAREARDAAIAMRNAYEVARSHQYARSAGRVALRVRALNEAERLYRLLVRGEAQS
jgi:hypothetical protein